MEIGVQKARTPVFPAYAGVILGKSSVYKNMGSFPPVCGGDPKFAAMQKDVTAFSPRMRG